MNILNQSGLSANRSGIRGQAPVGSRPIVNKWALPVCMLLALLLAAYLGQTSSALHYDREAVLDGEIYRLLTFHFVHLSIGHFVINIFTLAVLWIMYGRTMQVREWTGATVGCGLAIGAGLLLLSPEIEWSAGLSGLLYALFAFAAIRSAMSDKYLNCAVLAFLIAKVVMEQTIGPSAAMEHFVGSAIVVDAHMFGVLSGFLLGVAFRVSDGRAKASTRRSSELVADSGYFDGRWR